MYLRWILLSRLSSNNVSGSMHIHVHWSRVERQFLSFEFFYVSCLKAYDTVFTVLNMNFSSSQSNSYKVDQSTLDATLSNNI